MDPGRVDSVLQFSVATARLVHADDAMLQDLGPIHLIKYLYLADLAYSKKHGSTFTGIPWVFHHFGPYAASVIERIEPALAIPMIERDERSSRSGYDFIRWRIPEYDDAEMLQPRLAKKLPFEVAVALKQAIKEFGNDTSALLHHVYATEPMLEAAPGEELSFAAAVVTQPPTTRADGPSLRPKAVKKRDEALRAARQRFSELAKKRLGDQAERRAAQVPPRYDRVFEEGTQLLDELAGASPASAKGIMEFDEEIWKSKARKGPDRE